MITLNGVIQHPTTDGVARSYSVVSGESNQIEFTTAPASGVEIQVRHLGFAGATSSAVTGFYGRTGNVGLNADDHITTGDITSRNINSSGIVTATSFVGSGAALTGIDATAIKDSAGNVKIQAQASGAVHTGFSTMQNLRVTGIATFGTSSTVINGSTDTINVGTALTLGHTQGVQFHTQNLHSEGFEVNQINASGIITASQFKGDGSELTGVSGFSTALSNDTSTLLSQIFKTNVQHNIGAGTSVTIQSDAGSGNVAFTRLDRINVATGATIHVAAGTTFIMNVLNVF